MTLCPNKFPRIPPTTYRLAVVGEAPGRDELMATDSQGNPAPEPFVGASGRYLRHVLGSCGIATDSIFFGNICQHNPPSNDIENFSFDGPEISYGLERLRNELSQFRPHCTLILGRYAFRAFRPDLCSHSTKGDSIPLGDWRGSIIRSDAFGGVKAVGTYHPAYILRAYKESPLFKFDVARAVRQSKFAHIAEVARNKLLRPTCQQVLDYFAWFHETKNKATWDIEGYADDVGITMFSVARSPTDAIVVPFWLDGRNYWSEEEEVIVWQATATLLADASVPKEAHNAFYELFVSAWRHRMVVNNLHDDTMALHWELFPEAGGDPDDTDTGKKKRQGIGRDLGTCCSIYTEIPYYKDQRLAKSSDGKLDYSAMDSLATAEVGQAALAKLVTVPRSYAHYRFNINLIPPYNYIMLRGCRFDTAKARALAEDTSKEVELLRGEIDSTLARAFNVKSVVDKRWLLYEHLGYEPLKKWGNSTKEDVLLHYFTKHRNPLLRLIIRCIRKRTRLSDINKLIPDADGRIRSSFDPVGTNTGRLSSRHSIALRLTDEGWENTGTNLQNVTKELRTCFITDAPDFDFWQVDLSGADGWTVAADLASLGYPAMLDDYLAGIKPALVLYHMIQEHVAGRDVSQVNRLSRHDLRLTLKHIKQDIDNLEGQLDPTGRPLDWQYLCCKRVQHGSNYGAAPQKISEVIFGDSDGAIDLSVREATLYQHLYKLRYQTDHRNSAIKRRLSETGALVSACGIRRQFFGIRSRYEIDDATIREASAFEPQANTTWATNKALERLWYDVHNRQSSGALHVEPLLQIHDALAGQWRRRDAEWCQSKLREWFQNPLMIAGIPVTIPAEGKFGDSWKGCTTQFL